MLTVQQQNRLKFLLFHLPMSLTYKKLTSIFKSSKISGHLLLRNLKDPLVFSASPNFKSGHWKATSLTQVTEERGFMVLRYIYSGVALEMLRQPLFLKKYPKPIAN